MGAGTKMKWTHEEELALREGVQRYGKGKWRAIQKDPSLGPVLANRSNIDLKDKWRNINIKAPRRSPVNAAAEPCDSREPSSEYVAWPDVRSSQEPQHAQRAPPQPHQHSDSEQHSHGQRQGQRPLRRSHREQQRQPYPQNWHGGASTPEGERLRHVAFIEHVLAAVGFVDEEAGGEGWGDSPSAVAPCVPAASQPQAPAAAGSAPAQSTDSRGSTKRLRVAAQPPSATADSASCGAAAAGAAKPEPREAGATPKRPRTCRPVAAAPPAGQPAAASPSDADTVEAVGEPLRGALHAAVGPAVEAVADDDDRAAALAAAALTMHVMRSISACRPSSHSTPWRAPHLGSSAIYGGYE